MTIGICDWGIGGIGLCKLLREKSTVDIVYFSDSGFTPYGKVPVDELKTRLETVTGYFSSRGIEYIAVACNAASTVIPTGDKKITGIIEHGLAMVAKINPDKIVVVGGKRTIESGIFKSAFKKAGIKTTERIGQVLSARIEAGDISSKGLDNDVRNVFEPIKDEKYILLACTHYPAITGKIKAITGTAKLLNPDDEMANWILTNWHNLTGSSTVQWLTSGDTEEMKYSAEKAFGVKINDVKKITL